jgi:hypothetical protein
MGAPHFDITKQGKRSHSPKAAAPEKVAPKEPDPPTMPTCSRENPSDLREASKDAEDYSFGGRKEFQCTEGAKPTLDEHPIEKPTSTGGRKRSSTAENFGTATEEQPTAACGGTAAKNFSTMAARDETFSGEEECIEDTGHSIDEQPKAFDAGEATAAAEE